MLEAISKMFDPTFPASFVNFSFLPKYASYFVDGVLYTLALSIVAVLLAVIPALLLALMRLSKNKVIHTLSGAYIAIFRFYPLDGTVSNHLFWGLLYHPTRDLVFGFIRLDMFLPFVVSLALNSSAYVAEIFRAGILAVDSGQTEAARSLGLSQWQAMKLVVLPQAIKNVLPALANEVVTMVKESSVCSAYGMGELMFAAKNVAGTTLISVAPFVFVAFIYFCINFPASKAIEAIERRMRRGDKR